MYSEGPNIDVSPLGETSNYMFKTYILHHSNFIIQVNCIIGIKDIFECFMMVLYYRSTEY